MKDNKTTGFVYDDIFLKHWLEVGHPESPQRLRSIMELMSHSQLIEDLVNIPLKNNVLDQVLLIHTQAHTESLRVNYEESNEVALAAVGGILAATDQVCSGQIRNAFCATRPPGHHATNTGKIEGFCFYNGVAIASRYAQQKYGLRKVLIADWDYHHGNGTEASFYSEPSVLFFSTHDYYAYPGTGDPARRGEGEGVGLNINVHLACQSGDKEIIAAFEKKLLPAAHYFKPDLIIISAGFDSRRDDLLGCFDVSDEGYRKLTAMLMQMADQYCDGRIISVLEGGYTPAGLSTAVKTHVETLME